VRCHRSESIEARDQGAKVEDGRRLDDHFHYALITSPVYRDRDRELTLECLAEIYFREAHPPSVLWRLQRVGSYVGLGGRNSFWSSPLEFDGNKYGTRPSDPFCMHRKAEDSLVETAKETRAP
jgi:hypothetical protein